MNIIIVGADEIGSYMAVHLSRRSHAIVVIEKDETVAKKLDEQIDARVLNADGASVGILLHPLRPRPIRETGAGGRKNPSPFS